MSDTIDRLLMRQGVAFGDKTAVVDPTAQLSYRELDSATRGLAADFVESGVGKGTRVGLLMPNGVDWVCTALALIRVGAVLVPLSTMLAPPELIAHLRVAGVQTLVATEEFRGHRYVDELRTELDAPTLGTEHGPTIHPKLPALRQIWVGPVGEALPEAADRTRDVAAAMAAAVDPSDPMAIVFTSGSSGMPKGVIHSHGSALGAVQSSLAPRCIDSDTRLYLPMPFFWVGGLGGGVLSALVAGATLVTEPIPQHETTLQLLQRERVTLFRGWPEQAEALARHADSVGEALPELRQGSLEALLPPARRPLPGARASLFGMTEAFGPYCGFPADTDMPASAWGSCGKPFAGMEVRIVDIDTSNGVAAGDIGEIQLRGPHTLRGICRTRREDVFTADGFYPTGDLGHLDSDGFMFYHGRTDDMFKISGATVYPSEVERALRTLDGVRGAYVTRVPGERGDEVGAAVVCDVDCTAAQLQTAARTALSSFKIPTVWLLLSSDEQLPRGTTGKIDVVQLRDTLLRDMLS